MATFYAFLIEFRNVGSGSVFGDTTMLKFGKRLGGDRRSGKDRRGAAEAEADEAKPTVDERRTAKNRRSGLDLRDDVAAATKTKENIS